jgi:hypothetical protein
MPAMIQSTRKIILFNKSNESLAVTHSGIQIYRYAIILSYYVLEDKDIALERLSMARPIELGLILEGEDAKEFWKNEKNPKVTKEQIEMFKEAKRIYKIHFKA